MRRRSETRRLSDLRRSGSVCSDESGASDMYDEIACESPPPRRRCSSMASCEAQVEPSEVVVLMPDHERVTFSARAAKLCATLVSCQEVEGGDFSTCTGSPVRRASAGMNEVTLDATNIAGLDSASVRTIATACDRLAAGLSPSEVFASAPMGILLPSLRAAGFLGADSLHAPISMRLAMLIRLLPTQQIRAEIGVASPGMSESEEAATLVEDLFTPPSMQPVVQVAGRSHALTSPRPCGGGADESDGGDDFALASALAHFPLSALVGLKCLSVGWRSRARAQLCSWRAALLSSDGVELARLLELAAADVAEVTAAQEAAIEADEMEEPTCAATSVHSGTPSCGEVQVMDMELDEGSYGSVDSPVCLSVSQVIIAALGRIVAPRLTDTDTSMRHVAVTSLSKLYMAGCGPHGSCSAGEAPWFGVLASRVEDPSWWVAEAAAKAVTEAPNLTPRTAAAVRRELGRIAAGGETSRARDLAAATLRGARWEARRNELRDAWMLQPEDMVNAELRRRGLRTRVGKTEGDERESGLTYRVNGGKARAVDAIVDDEMRHGRRAALPS